MPVPKPKHPFTGLIHSISPGFQLSCFESQVSTKEGWNWTLLLGGEGTLEHAVHDIVPDKEESPKVDAAGDDDKNTGEYMIENAKSSRSICKSCNEKIEKGEVCLNILPTITKQFQHHTFFFTPAAISTSCLSLSLSSSWVRSVCVRNTGSWWSAHVIFTLGGGCDGEQMGWVWNWFSQAQVLLLHLLSSSHWRALAKSQEVFVVYLVMGGKVRIATMVDNPRFRGKQPAWRHVKCFLEKNWWTSPMEAMPGWDHLSVKDQAHVQTLAKDFTG